MSHDRKGYYNRDRDRDPRDRDRDLRIVLRDRDRDRDRERERDHRDWRQDYRGNRSRKRSRSPNRDSDKRRSRSPRKSDKDMIDDNILSEISKLPEPSELWDSNQFQEGAFPPQPPPPAQGPFPDPPAFGANYQPTYSGMYDDFPPPESVAPQAPPPMASWNQMSLPPPPLPQTFNVEDQMKKEAAIESEMRHQKAALSKQREDYIKKAGILKKELDTLKDQRNELRGDPKRSPSPDTKRFLKENTKLQLEIQNKLKTITNVVDMLNGIIGEDAQEVPLDTEESPSERKRKSRSPSQKFNYVYYDPEMHWCRVCNEFPPTAKDYLNHLHSAAHHKMAAAHMEAPWHSLTGVNEGFASYPSAPTKRTPIRGLQFFVPSTAWYCKLCDQFIGDLHCASAHLKSVVHSKNYTNFVEQNPHWETDWMSDRQKAFEKVRAAGGKGKPAPAPPAPAPHAPPGDKPPAYTYTAHTITFNKDGFHTKKKKSVSPMPEEKKKKKDKKKKRKKSSSSSSDSSSSDSDTPKKKLKKLKHIDTSDDKALDAWMREMKADRLSDSDRKLLDTIKSRIRKEQRESEKRRSSSRDRDDKSRPKESDRDREKRSGSRWRERDRERERDRREERERERERDDRPEPKKPEIKKMPFIGKMPVYKHLGKPKADEQKKEEVKKDETKKEEDDSVKKKQEMDAEIQRKVAEFKEKIAKAQLEKQAQVGLPPPPIALPTALAQPLPPPLIIPTPPPQVPVPGQPALQKDFQDALDIIFPTDAKATEKLQQDIFNVISNPGLLGPPPLGMPGFPHMGLSNLSLQTPHMFLNRQLPTVFGPQLYDQHVPIRPNNKQRQNNQRQNNQRQNNNKNRMQNKDNKQNVVKKPLAGNNVGKTQESNKVNAKADITAAKKKEEMDDLAMLGIDVSDVGSGM